MNTATEREMKLTVRELRLALFELEDQKMTIQELRRKLFDVDQDKLIELSNGMWWKLGVEK